MFNFFFFKQKTAYEMRISDWSSDVCSSDLVDSYVDIYNSPALPEIFKCILHPKHTAIFGEGDGDIQCVKLARFQQFDQSVAKLTREWLVDQFQIGRASCRERVCQYV